MCNCCYYQNKCFYSILYSNQIDMINQPKQNTEATEQSPEENFL